MTRHARPSVPARAVEVRPAGPVAGRLAAPASKSVTNRLLVIAALAEGTSVLDAPLASDDSRAMLTAVEALGAAVPPEADAPTWHITGTGGRLSSPPEPVSVGLSGTAMRFAVAMATLPPRGATVSGDAPLRRRVIGPLVTALTGLGAAVRDRDGYPPVDAAGGGLAGGAVTVDVSASSQFASAVLLVAPYARGDVTLEVRGPAATDYIALTAEVMGDWGAQVTRLDAARWRVAAGHRYVARHRRVEYDASAAAHLLSFAAATGGRVTVSNAAAGTRQPDAGLPAVLASMGCRVDRDGDAVTVTGPDQLAPVSVDLAAMPDQVTTVAALAALAEGASRITGAAVTRGHETDRLAALAVELGKVGVVVEELPDGLVVQGGRARGPARLATHDDHRLAMAFAALAARVPDVVVEEPWCVTKTYPGFWADVAGLGVQWCEQ